MSAATTGTWAGATAVARTNWLRASKDRRAPLTIVVLPILIMLVVGTVFGVDDRTPVGVVDHDGGQRAVQLRSLIADSGSLRLRVYTSEDRMRSDLRRLRVLAALVIPHGYTQRLDAGQRAVVGSISQPGRGESIIARATVARVVARQGLDVLAQRATGRSTIAARTDARRDTRYGPANGDVSPFSYTAPSNLVLFVFLTSLVFGSGLVSSRQTGVLRRMLAAPVSARAIVAGQAVTAFVVALVQAVGLLAVGAVFFRVRWGDPAAVVVLVLVLALAAAGLNMLMGSVARTPEQAVAVGVPLGIAMAMLGGCMWPLEGVGAGLRSFGHLTPHAWAMDAWVRLIFVRASLADVARYLLVLLGFAVVLFPLATWRVRRLMTRV